MKQEKEWALNYWSDSSGKQHVEAWLDELNKEELKSVAKELKLLKEFGNTLKLPHSRSLKLGFI